MSLYSEFIRSLRESKEQREYRKTIKQLVQHIRKLEHSSEPDKSRKIPGLQTDAYKLENYTVRIDYQVRGDLISITSRNTIHGVKEVVCEYGDQTRQYGSFLGICRDAIWPDKETALQLISEIQSRLTPAPEVANNYPDF